MPAGDSDFTYPPAKRRCINSIHDFHDGFELDTVMSLTEGWWDRIERVRLDLKRYSRGLHTDSAKYLTEALDVLDSVVKGFEEFRDAAEITKQRRYEFEEQQFNYTLLSNHLDELQRSWNRLSDLEEEFRAVFRGPIQGGIIAKMMNLFVKRELNASFPLLTELSQFRDALNKLTRAVTNIETPIAKYTLHFVDGTRICGAIYDPTDSIYLYQVEHVVRARNAEKLSNLTLSFYFDDKATQNIPEGYSISRSSLNIHIKPCQCKWKEQEASSPVYRRVNMAFVNREDSTRDLVMVHDATLERKRTGVGLEWMYPICVNDLGCGKSAFADNYLSLVKDLDPSSMPILPILQKAIYVKRSTAAAPGPPHDNLGHSILLKVKQELGELLENKEILNEMPQTDLTSFICSLLQRSDRALFLVLDEIGSPFFTENDYDLDVQGDQKTWFNKFILSDICPLLMCKENVFLLLCGSASFLDWVGANPNETPLRSSKSCVKAVRISLNMIRPDKIVSILQRTVFRPTNESPPQTIGSFLGLDETRYQQYAQQLYEITAGHPRTLSAILNSRCVQIVERNVPISARPEFTTENEEAIAPLALEFIRSTAIRFWRSANVLIRECRKSETDILEKPTVDGIIRYRDLLPALRISFQSNGSSKFTIPKRVLIFLECLLIDLIDFLKSVATTNSMVPLNFPLEIVVGKAFMQQFPENQEEQQLNRLFFGSPEFTQFAHQGFYCSKRLKRFPKVTNRSTCKDYDNGSSTISTDYARRAIAKFKATTEGDNCWLIPEPMSHSPDLIHVSRYGLVMVAVKNYSRNSNLSESAIKDEISKAELMVEPGCPAFLFIAATQYSAPLQNQFQNGKSFVVLKNVQLDNLIEVILLDLTTPQKREEFFCCRGNATAKKGLEKIVQMTMRHECSSIRAPTDGEEANRS